VPSPCEQSDALAVVALRPGRSIPLLPCQVRLPVSGRWMDHNAAVGWLTERNRGLSPEGLRPASPQPLFGDAATSIIDPSTSDRGNGMDEEQLREELKAERSKGF